MMTKFPSNHKGTKDLFSYNDGAAPKYGFESLEYDREIVLAAVNNHGAALKFASESFRSDREIVLAAVNNDGAALEFASKELRGDREVVLVACGGWEEEEEEEEEESDEDYHEYIDEAKRGWMVTYGFDDDP